VLGPEVTGLKGEKVQSYTTSLNLDLLDGIASHLYEGESWRVPDSYQHEMRGVATQMGAKPIFQTEFSVPGGEGAFETAWLIRNSLVELGASAYLHWDLVWTGEDGLISIENPQQIAGWQSAKGYKIRDTYYSLKHFAAFTEPGDERVAVVSADQALAPVAFRSDDGRRITVVALNTAQQTYRLHIEVPNVPVQVGELYRTSAAERCQAVGSVVAGQSFTMPPRSIATLVLSSR
jgi:O-glycosyl hydrolase